MIKIKNIGLIVKPNINFPLNVLTYKKSKKKFKKKFKKNLMKSLKNVF